MAAEEGAKGQQDHLFKQFSSDGVGGRAEAAGCAERYATPRQVASGYGPSN